MGVRELGTDRGSSLKTGLANLRRLQAIGREQTGREMRWFMTKMATLVRQPLFVLLWLAPIWIMIGLAAAAIRLVRLKRLAPVLGRNVGPTALVPLATAKQIERALRIKHVLAMAAKFAPFRSDCYPQAIVAQLMCRLYGLPSAAHFGVRLEGGQTELPELLAHAWVVCGRVAICGRHESFRKFTVVGCFASPRMDDGV